MTLDQFREKYGTDMVSVFLRQIAAMQLLGPKTEQLLEEIADNLKSVLTQPTASPRIQPGDRGIGPCPECGDPGHGHAGAVNGMCGK